MFKKLLVICFVLFYGVASAEEIKVCFLYDMSTPGLKGFAVYMDKIKKCDFLVAEVVQGDGDCDGQLTNACDIPDFVSRADWTMTAIDTNGLESEHSEEYFYFARPKGVKISPVNDKISVNVGVGVQ